MQGRVSGMHFNEGGRDFRLGLGLGLGLALVLGLGVDGASLHGVRFQERDVFKAIDGCNMLGARLRHNHNHWEMPCQIFFSQWSQESYCLLPQSRRCP